MSGRVRTLYIRVDVAAHNMADRYSKLVMMDLIASENFKSKRKLSYGHVHRAYLQE